MENQALYTTVTDYLNDQSDEAKKKLYELRDLIFEVFPSATELVNYNILAYALVKGGKRDQQVMIAGFKNHVGFYPLPSVIEHFSNELTAYKYAKGSVQFPLKQPLPKELIIRMLKYRKSLSQK